MGQRTYHQRKRAASQPERLTDRNSAPALPAALRRATNAGRPLDTATRATLEPRFGHSFADVRVHSDTNAAESAAALGARAYTVGSDIVFDEGQYAPETSEGERLLAHELAHVVQRRAGPPATKAVSQSGDAAEHEARAAADQVVAGEAAQVQTTPSAALSREENDPFDWYNFNPTPVLPKGLNLGWEPAGDNEGLRPYAYNKSNARGTGIEFGAGALHGQNKYASVDLGPSINGKAGEWATENGNARYGYSMNATGMPIGNKSSLRLPGYGSLDTGLGTASLDLNAGTDGFSLGAQANVAEAALTIGQTNTGGDHDESFRMGASEGLGLAGRGYWGNEDKSGYRTYGFGFDAGPFSMDVKTKDPLRTALTYGAGMLMPLGLGPLGSLAAKHLLPEKGNMTDQLANMAGLTIKDANFGTTMDVLKDFGSQLIPDISMPNIGLPDFGLPNIGLPDFGLPNIGLPDFGLPDFSTPGPTLPDRGFPGPGPSSLPPLAPGQPAPRLSEREIGPSLIGFPSASPGLGLLDRGFPGPGPFDFGLPDFGGLNPFDDAGIGQPFGVPDFGLPDIGLPDLSGFDPFEDAGIGKPMTVPDFGLPDLGDLPIPDLGLPEGGQPELGLPMPDIGLPMPDIGLPEGGLPELGLPMPDLGLPLPDLGGLNPFEDAGIGKPLTVPDFELPNPLDWF